MHVETFSAPKMTLNASRLRHLNTAKKRMNISYCPGEDSRVLHYGALQVSILYKRTTVACVGKVASLVSMPQVHVVDFVSLRTLQTGRRRRAGRTWAECICLLSIHSIIALSMSTVVCIATCATHVGLIDVGGKCVSIYFASFRLGKG